MERKQELDTSGRADIPSDKGYERAPRKRAGLSIPVNWLVGTLFGRLYPDLVTLSSLEIVNKAVQMIYTNVNESTKSLKNIRRAQR